LLAEVTKTPDSYKNKEDFTKPQEKRHHALSLAERMMPFTTPTFFRYLSKGNRGDAYCFIPPPQSGQAEKNFVS